MKEENMIIPDFSKLPLKTEEQKKAILDKVQNNTKNLKEIERMNIIEKEANWNKIVEETEIPPKYRNCRLEDMKDINDENIEKCVEICTKYAKNFETYQKDGKGILMIGSPGRLKTSLACATALEILRKADKKVYFLSMAKFYAEDQKNVDKKDLIIIDDLGIEYLESEKLLKKLAQILIILNDNKTPIIVTTNLRIDDIIMKYPIKIYTRIKEMTNFKLLMNGKSFRK